MASFDNTLENRWDLPDPLNPYGPGPVGLANNPFHDAMLPTDPLLPPDPTVPYIDGSVGYPGADPFALSSSGLSDVASLTPELSASVGLPEVDSVTGGVHTDFSSAADGLSGLTTAEAGPPGLIGTGGPSQLPFEVGARHKSGGGTLFFFWDRLPSVCDTLGTGGS
jgi:hypothetical protein